MGGDYNAWEDWQLQGKIITTILRGTPLLEDEQWVGSRTDGRYQPRALDPHGETRGVIEETSARDPSGQGP